MSERSTSLQGRLSLRLATLFVLMFVAGMAMLSTRYRAETVELQAARLADAIGGIAESLAVNGRGELSLPSAEHRGVDDYVIRDAAGRVLLASSANAAERLGLPPLDWRQGVHVGSTGDRPGRENATAFARVTTAAGPVTIQVGHTESEVEISRLGMIDTLTNDVLPIMLPLMVAVLIIGVLTIRDSLAPMQELARRAAVISPTATDVRLPAAGLPPELTPLVVAINGALERLDEGFRMQREFTADAAHELRTPLAILASHLDSLAVDE